MPFFKCDFRVNTDFVFPDNEKQPVVLQTTGTTTKFRNGPVDSDGAISCLIAEVVGNVASVDIAITELRANLAAQLDLLAFVAQSRFKIVEEIRLIEWEPHQKSRMIYILSSQDARYPPEPHPLEIFIKSSINIEEAKPQSYVRKALKYFRLGLLEEQLEDQFMRFWLALEIIAENSKNDIRSPITCMKCGAPLLCECGQTQSRKPMAKDAILDLMNNISEGAFVNISRNILDARNALMHGSSVATVEKKCKLSMGQLTEHLGVVSWSGIEGAMSLPRDKEIVVLDRDGDFAPMRLTLKAHLSFSHEGTDPHPSEDTIPNATAQILTSFKPFAS
jgi:hypothetical protein